MVGLGPGSVYKYNFKVHMPENKELVIPWANKPHHMLSHHHLLEICGYKCL